MYEPLVKFVFDSNKNVRCNLLIYLLMPSNHIRLIVQTTMTSFDCILIKSVPVAFDYLMSEVRCHTRELCQQYIYPYIVVLSSWFLQEHGMKSCVDTRELLIQFTDTNIRRINVQLVESFSSHTALFAHQYTCTCISNKFCFSLPSFERNVFTVDFLKYMYFIFKFCHNCIFIVCAIFVDSIK